MGYFLNINYNITYKVFNTVQKCSKYLVNMGCYYINDPKKTLRIHLNFSMLSLISLSFPLMYKLYFDLFKISTFGEYILKTQKLLEFEIY